MAELKLGARPVACSEDVIAVVDRTVASVVSAISEQRGSLALVPRATDSYPSVGHETPVEGACRASRVLDAVARGARHTDEICAMTGLVAAEVSRLLSVLELEGGLYRDGSGAVRLVGA